MYYSDDFGCFTLTPEMQGAVQWENGEQALEFLESFKKDCLPSLLEVLNHMKVVPVGYN